MKKKKIGLFGGTFDPIHFGHLNLAFELMEKRGLDEVWFIPVTINPHKQKTTPTSFEHRFNMLNLAIKEIPQFKVNDIEKGLPSPSYTFNTLTALLAQTSNEQIQFYFLMGEDALGSFLNWHQPTEIVRQVPLLIGSRSEKSLLNHLDLKESPSVEKAIKEGITHTRLMDISGTFLRTRLRHNIYCGHLIPSPVLDYINEHQLYAFTP